MRFGQQKGRTRSRMVMALVIAISFCGLGSAAAEGDEAAEDDGGPLLTGVIEINVGFRRYDSSDDPDSNDEVFTYGGAGRVNVPLMHGFSGQLDLQTEIYEDGADEAPEGAHAVTGHLNWRNDMFLVGGFIGGGQVSVTDQNDDTTGFVTGGEMQVYLGNLTLYPQAGYGHFQVDDGEGFQEGWFAGIEARYFLSDNCGIRGGFSYGETDEYIDGNDEGEFWNWEAEVFGRLNEKLPIYGTIGYQGGFYDATSEDDDVDDHRLIFGLRFVFGAESLLENDRRGATLSTPMLPMRAAAWTEGLD